MEMVNRMAIVVLPREPLLDWINEHQPDQVVRMEDIAWQGNIYLIPEFDTLEEAELHVEEIFDDIFQHELAEWSPDDSTWPTPRIYEMFLEWFDVMYDVVVFDTVEGPLEKE